MINKKLFSDLLMLFTSKSGSILVGIFVLPLYQKLLGQAQFGVASMIFALQAFLVNLDCGTSTIVGRDISAVGNTCESLITMRAGSLVLHSIYVIIFIFVQVLGFLFLSGENYLIITLSVFFFWFLAVQNSGQTALMALKRYKLAALIQTGGVLFRSGYTVASLIFFNPSIINFLCAQVVSAFGQLVVTALICDREFNFANANVSKLCYINRAKEIALQGRPLILFGLAGAAVMNLDKPIVATFLSPASLASYFLACSICLTPATVLASPVVQYFQPHIFQGISSGKIIEIEHHIWDLSKMLLVAVVIPSAILWIARGPVVNRWLNSQSNVAEVTRCVSVLLPGVMIGAFGYIPFTLLTAYRDFKFQAVMSLTLTILTMLAAFACAYNHSLRGVCLVYAIYHSTSAVVSSIRSLYIVPCELKSRLSRLYKKVLFIILISIIALILIDLLLTIN